MFNNHVSIIILFPRTTVPRPGRFAGVYCFWENSRPINRELNVIPRDRHRNFRILERHSKAKRTRAPAYSRTLRRIKGVVQRVVHGKLRSNFQGVRGDRVAVKVGVVQGLQVGVLHDA